MESREKPDILLIASIALILLIGLMALYSASNTNVGANIFKRQVIWVTTGFFVFVIALRMSFRKIEELSPLFFVICCILLIITLFVGRGPVGRWLMIGPIGIQTSEIAKAGLILYAAWWLSSLSVRPRKFGEALVLLSLLPVIVLTAVQPDLGTSISMLLIVLAMFSWSGYGPEWIFLLISPILAAVSSTNIYIWLVFMLILIGILFFKKYPISRWVLLLGGNSVIAALTPFAWNLLRPYQQSRLITFLNPASDPHGAGWNIIQSEVAVGSGGVFGQGYLQGAQKELAFLPARHTDFIFSVWAEETGFFGGIILLGMFAVLFWRISLAAKRSVNPFNSLVAAGIASYLLIHVTVNVGMALGVMPVTGLPLPLMSYGGSQMVIVLFLLGLSVNAGMYWREI